MDTSDYRNQIDSIDEEIVNLFSKRMAVAAEIAKLKKENGAPVFDPKREKEKIISVINNAPDELKDYTPLLYSTMLELSRSYQHRLIDGPSEITSSILAALESTSKLFPEKATVACQGVYGANSQTACDRLFRYPETMFFSSFEAVFTAIEKGLCRFGVIPLENSNAGSVNAVYDLMMRHKCFITRSIRVKIEHNILTLPGAKFENIKEIYSHPQAISQCSEFLGGLKGVKVIPCENTAIAAQMVAESGRDDIAAIASIQCTDYYGLECVKEAVQNTDNNYTRFICISKDLEIFPGADRTSIMLTLHHEPGSLYKIMSRFNSLGINLIKLESRPLPQREFEFMFYFDLDTPVYSPKLLELLGELPAQCESFQYLGSYSEII